MHGVQACLGDESVARAWKRAVWRWYTEDGIQILVSFDYRGSRVILPAVGSPPKELHPLMVWWAILYKLSMLEAGMGSFSPNWYWDQRELASTVRNVAYDHAGFGWSRCGRPRDAKTVAVELGDALREAGIEPPSALAGPSFGGLPVRASADLYHELTAATTLGWPRRGPRRSCRRPEIVLSGLDA
jgi:hypothetical protein